MKQVAVLVIEDGASEAGMVSAALALRPEVLVVESADAQGAIERLADRDVPAALAIAGRRALADSPADLVKDLGERGIPVVGIAAGLSAAAEKVALAAGVREIHRRPTTWRPYSELIEAVVARFIRTDSPPPPDRTS